MRKERRKDVRRERRKDVSREKERGEQGSEKRCEIREDVRKEVWLPLREWLPVDKIIGTASPNLEILHRDDNIIAHC